MKQEIVYISYDGMTDPLGQSQVIPYVKGLTEKGYSFTILSYEKPDKFRSFGKTLAEQLSAANIKWKPLRYHKRFSIAATLYDLLNGFFFLLFFIPSKKVKIIHCRSYISSILGLIFKKIYGTKFIFDMRGFWADERIEGGIFKSRLLYNFFKWLEKHFIKNADATISLTNNAIKEMSTWPYMSAKEISRLYHITTCCNIESYLPTYNHRLESSKAGNIEFVYVGSIGPWHSYKEITEFVSFAYNYLPHSSFKMIINWGKEDFIKFLLDEKLNPARFQVLTLSHKEVPEALKNSDIGFFFIPPVYAKRSSSPTKMGEMLAAGIPIITGHSIGDVDELVNQNGVGAIITSFNIAEYKKAIDTTLSLINVDKTALQKRCLSLANDYFSLEKGVQKYFEIYKSLQ